MPAATAPAPTQARYMQGIAVPASSVRPTDFFARTRRRRQPEANRQWAGPGLTDTIELKKTDILAELLVRVVGSVTLANGTGAVASTARWPYDLAKAIRFTANGQSNLMNASGAKFRLREMCSKGDLSDRGIAQTIGGATVSNGTLSLASEAWGFGSNTAAIAPGTYNFDIEISIPIAEDQKDLMGAIFAQTSSTDLTLAIDWANIADLFVLTGTATAVFGATTLQVEATRYSIPLGPDGQIIVPDLSTFHSFIQTRYANGLASGDNELRLVGQGAGKTLLRLISQVWNGATPAPLSVTDANFGHIAWRFGGNETPDDYVASKVLRYFNERSYNSDIGGPFGFFVHEFAAENAFRDAVDLGTASEWRNLINIANGVVLTNPVVESVAESVFAAGAGS